MKADKRRIKKEEVADKLIGLIIAAVDEDTHAKISKMVLTHSVKRLKPGQYQFPNKTYQIITGE